MSYFYATFNKPRSATERLESIFADMGTPGPAHQIIQDQWAVTRYEQDKVIPDIVLQHHHSNSWIVFTAAFERAWRRWINFQPGRRSIICCGVFKPVCGDCRAASPFIIPWARNG